MSDEIHSALWKAALLSTESSYFPRLVEAAAWHVGKEYTPHMLRKISTSIEIVDAFTIPIKEGVVEGVDAVLSEIAKDENASAAMDEMIVTAVHNYQPPPSSPAGGVPHA